MLQVWQTVRAKKRQKALDDLKNTIIIPQVLTTLASLFFERMIYICES